jgi:rootletin
LERKMQQTVQQMGGQKDGEIQQLQERVEALQQHIDKICQQHEEVLLRAENDKQQALLLGKQADVTVWPQRENARGECILFLRVGEE